MTDQTHDNPGALRDALDENETLRQELDAVTAERGRLQSLIGEMLDTFWVRPDDDSPYMRSSWVNLATLDTWRHIHTAMGRES